jgi:invasion protein IalB
MRALTILYALLMLLIASVTAGAQSPPPQPPRINPKPPSDQPIPAGEQKAWVKLCDDVTTNDNGGAKAIQRICLTSHERLDGNTGNVLVSVAIRQSQGQDKQSLLVLVPLGVLEQPGLVVNIYPQDLWQKAQRGENVDDAKLYQLRLSYTLCQAAGCSAETDANVNLVEWMKRGGGMVVLVMTPNGKSFGFGVPLAGFAATYAGASVDNQEYAQARKKLLEEIAERQKKLKQQTDQ